MARKRMIDPSIWQDEGMAELTPRQQLLYIGQFSNPDDEGRLKGSESALRLTLPTLYGGVMLEDIHLDVDAVLVAFRQLVRYECDGRVYIAFRNYRHWQRIDKPSPSVLPAPPDDDDDSPTPTRMLPDMSPSLPLAVPPSRKEEKLSEEKGTEGKVVRAPARERRRAAVLERSPEEAAVLAVLSRVSGFPTDVGDDTTEKLREYAADFADVDLLEVAKALRDKGSGVKNGWSTYRNWLKSERENGARHARAAPTPFNGRISNEQAKFSRSIAALQGVGGYRGPADLPDEHGPDDRRLLR
jgi:hypothetical protein